MNMFNDADSFSNDLYYREEDIILDEFKHVKTPKKIIESLNGLKEIARQRNMNNSPFAYSFKSDEIAFVKESLKSKWKRHEECGRTPFHGFYCTFSDMDENQKKWYFYWRERVLNGEYLFTDLSYIYVFVYELINYSFNPNAPFNISMLARLYEAYKNEYKIERLQFLISDMLFEAGEMELANKWNPYKEDIPILYEHLRERESEELSRIPINDWKNYVRSRKKSIYFKENRNKVYKTFKECIHLLEEVYQKENKRMVDVYFESKMVKRRKYLYSGMVVFRESDQSMEFETEVFVPTEQLFQDITSFYRMCENVTRLINGETRQLPMEENTLPEELKDIMLEYLLRPKQKGRFKTVQKGNGMQKGSLIPNPPSERKPVVIEFNEERIKQLQDETNNLVEEVEKRTIEIEEEKIEEVLVEAEKVENPLMEEIKNQEEVKTNGLENFFSTSSAEIDEEQIEEFIEQLSEVEKEFIQQFDNMEWSKQEATLYAKQKGSMLGVLIQTINEKALENLEDVLIEEDDEILLIVEDFQDVFIQIKEREGI